MKSHSSQQPRNGFLHSMLKNHHLCDMLASFRSCKHEALEGARNQTMNTEGAVASSAGPYMYIVYMLLLCTFIMYG